MNQSSISDRQFVEQCTKFILNTIPKEGLISLYLSGRFLTPDRAPSSDIDYFAIVNSNYNKDVEKQINTILENKYEIEIRLRLFYITDFEGKTLISPVCKTKENVQLFLKLFRHNKFELVYGSEINFELFNTKSLSHIDELKIDLGFVREGIKALREHNFEEDNRFRNVVALSKMILHLGRIEATLRHLCEYEPFFYKIAQVLEAEQEHIFHKALEIRKGKELTTQEKKAYVNECEAYANHIEDQYLKN